MNPQLNVVELWTGPREDVAQRLRELARKMESGELHLPELAVLIAETPGKKLDVYAIGSCDVPRAIGVMALAAQSIGGAYIAAVNAGDRD